MPGNVLLIMTDQQRYDTIGGFNNPIIRTPALRRLASEGTMFNRAYTPSPVCVPARFSLLTGLYPHRTGCADNGPMPEGHLSLMQYLGSQGYQTHGVGKMHFTFEGTGSMSQWGFGGRDTSEEVDGAERDDYLDFLAENGYGYVEDAHGVRGEMYYIPQPSQLPARLHHTAWVADRSIRFLENRDPGKPFFLMASFIKPHPPFEAPAPWNKLYRAPEMPFPHLPEGYETLLTHYNRVQNRYKYRDRGSDLNLLRCMRAYYYACVSFIDYNVGRLLDYMQKAGLMDDTLVVYTSDHGEMLGDYGSFGKRGFLDACARVPLIVRRPGQAPGGVVNTAVSLTDVFPTVAEFAGYEQPAGLDGRSLFGLDNTDMNREVVSQMGQGSDGVYMLADGRYKFFHSCPDGKDYLLDAAADPAETRNLAYNLMYREKAVDMRLRLARKLREAGHTLPLDGGDFAEFPSQALPPDPDAGLLFQDGRPVEPIAGYERD